MAQTRIHGSLTYDIVSGNGKDWDGSEKYLEDAIDSINSEW